MRLPLSLHARVVLIAIVTVCATLAVTTYSILNIITWVVSDNMDVALDAEIHMLDQAIASDGSFVADRIAGVPLLTTPEPGWGWQVVSTKGRWETTFPRGRMIFPMPRVHPEDGIYSGYGTARSGEELHIRRLETRREDHGAVITVVSPSSLIDGPLQRVRNVIYRSLILVFLVLATASVIQLHFGLRPLRRLGKAIGRIRSGEAQSVPDPQPAELAPLAAEINALIERNHAGLATARLNAANLAHAVKTPLASLMLQLEHEKASAESKALVAHISERVTHHLRRARSGAAGLGTRVRTDVHDVVEGIRPVLASVRRDGAVRIDNRLPKPCFVAVEKEDVDEMLGNLLENACRYARCRIVVSGEYQDRSTAITIEDDGKGVPAAQRALILQPGVRLDETGEGYGLGLAIVRELAELYGGAVILAESAALSGLRTTLRLPR